LVGSGRRGSPVNTQILDRSPIAGPRRRSPPSGRNGIYMGCAGIAASGAPEIRCRSGGEAGTLRAALVGDDQVGLLEDVAGGGLEEGIPVEAGRQLERPIEREQSEAVPDGAAERAERPVVADVAERVDPVQNVERLL